MLFGDLLLTLEKQRFTNMSKTENIYALLVGINQYAPESRVNPLRGCVNDVHTMESYLKERISKDIHCEVKTLINEEATYTAIVDGFRNHLGKAKSEQDTVLFCFSGHGSQEPAPEEFWHLEPDRKNETLVCYDSRTDNGKDLADKELAYLIGELAKNNPHIVVIMDNCHSGSGTRDPFQQVEERRIPESTKPRSLDTYLFPATQLDFPRGKHMVFSACRDYQTAKEYKDGDNNDRGAFSHFLGEALKRSNGNVSYRDLFQETNALIRGNISEQSPQMEGDESDWSFLGAGAVAERQQYFTASYNKELGWVIDGGAVHGIAAPTQGQFTRLALFPFTDAAGNPSDLSQLANAVVQADVNEVRPALSKLKLEQQASLDQQATYKAVVISQPISPMLVALEGDQAGISLVRQAIQVAGANQTPSLYVKEATDTDSAQFRVIAQHNEYIIARPADARPLVEQVQGYTTQSASTVIRNLEHIDRWRKVVELSREANSSIPADAVKLSIMHPEKDEEISISDIKAEKNEATLTSGIRLSYKYDTEKQEWQTPAFRIRLKNTTQNSQPLYCSLFDLTEQFGITPILKEKAVRLNAGEEVWVQGGSNGNDTVLYGQVLDSLWEQGITEYKDILKLIVCTTDFNPTLLEQGDLGSPIATRSIDLTSSLDCLLDSVITRHLSFQKKSCDDWIAQSVTFTVVRPKEASPLNAQSVTNLGSGVSIKPHPNFTAEARLTTIPQSSRDVGGHILPNILQSDYEVVQPFTFTTTRGSDPGLSALELSNLPDDPSLLKQLLASVTPENPLQLAVARTSLAPEEELLAIGYDGEFFLPVGLGRNKGDGIEINLERLPEPMSQGERSLGGSIRIFFQKVISKRLKLDFDYPLLSAVTVHSDEAIKSVYDTIEASVKEKVAQASRIVLFVHGVIGDTESMVPSVHRAKVEVNGQAHPLFDPNVYDLVLAFDYENLNTSIEDNARLLKQRLEAVGLGNGHGKTLHIVAHSMGGLVSRWFIEREGGKDVVNHLIMLGTPNNGSPLPNIVDFVLPLLTIGLNGLAAVAWPVSAIGALMHLAGAATVGAERQMTTALKEMQPESTLVQTLFSSESPGIPYTVIAGNTSLIPVKNVESQRKIEALLQRIGRSVVDLPFMGAANDIAVKVNSITHLPVRSPAPKVTQVACDHLTYFSDPAGLKALADAVKQALQLGSDQSAVPPSTNPSGGIQPETIRASIATPDPIGIDAPQVLSATQTPAARQVEIAPVETVRVSPPETSTPTVVQNNAQTALVTEASGLPKWAIGVIGVLLGAIVLLGLSLWKQPQNQQPARQSGVAQPQAEIPKV
jgi:pimeloyl-ACP methyl ester carboxylesterase